MLTQAFVTDGTYSHRLVYLIYGIALQYNTHTLNVYIYLLFIGWPFPSTLHVSLVQGPLHSDLLLSTTIWCKELRHKTKTKVEKITSTLRGQ